MYRAFRAVFLCMYLKKLYKQNKFWFAIVLLFAFSQLFLNYKNGLELSPFYHYGMFSLPFHFAPAYECVEVSVNGKLLQAKDFTPNGWDNVVMPVIEYTHQSAWNSTMYNQTIHRLLHTADSVPYTYRFPQSQFSHWYQQRIQRLLNMDDTSITIRYDLVQYRQKNGMLLK